MKDAREAAALVRERLGHGPGAGDVRRRSLRRREPEPGQRNKADLQSGLTVADAAVATGLSLHDAETGLHALVSECRGHLRVGEGGDLVFLFPNGFEKPWLTKGRLARAASWIFGVIAGGARFVVRAWVAIVLVGYVALFLALFIAISISKENASEKLGSLVGVLLRLVFEAFFWMFHPFSPFALSRERDYFRSHERMARAAHGEADPFYERVDRFFFGPKTPPVDEASTTGTILAEIRRLKGRIGLADVMRITGLPRSDADPLMSKLMVDYGGTVEVSDEGGIAYRFPALRKTARSVASAIEGAPRPARAPAIWAEKKQLPRITANSTGTNVLIGSLNLFNLLAAWWALANNMTIERVIALLRGLPAELLPPPGTPIVLGVIPLVFSILLFVLPLGRLLWRPFQRRRVARENGRRALVRAVIEGARSKTASKDGIEERELKQQYRVEAGFEPTDAELAKHVAELGGEVDVERSTDGIRYRFPDIELEAKAVEAEREAASDEEVKVGPIVFTSEA